ncbi:MAG: CPXCG motif-containing cysteine-rich protein [Acidobacteriaceae bacterium]
MNSGFQCAGCGEWNETSVDESVGRRQSYIEDCQICCKPNILLIIREAESGEFTISSELE